jgi:hypothetical protein
VRPKARWKDDAENERRGMAIVNWKHVVQERDGGEQLGRCLSFLESGATSKEEK